ncbi:MAG: hypothetical protein M1835_002905 [Candelina submexicana]|nr:MAG: hypothetical protein M1835_002905 [Candelina submexicana]
MSPKCIFLTGAPECNGITWNSQALDGSFLPAIHRFLENRTNDAAGKGLAKDTSASELRPAWRSIPLIRQHLHTGMSQGKAHAPADEAALAFEWHGRSAQHDMDASFFTTTSVSFDSEVNDIQSEPDLPEAESGEDVLSHFYEHSFAVHEDILSSQIAVSPEPLSRLFQSDTSDATGISFYSTEFDSTSFLSTTSPAAQLGNVKASISPISGPISDLRNIPNASYLNSITPQTMTVNLLVGLISVAPSRTIKTRHGGREMEIVEMLVGDETKAGFGINFWLLPTPTNRLHQQADNDLRQVLSGIRPQDIVLVRNAALSSFRGKVFGQSLRKNVTKVNLMYRDIIDSKDERGAYSASDLEQSIHGNDQVAKTKRVKDWVTHFVGPAVNLKFKGAVGIELPPDTQ